MLLQTAGFPTRTERKKYPANRKNLWSISALLRTCFNTIFILLLIKGRKKNKNKRRNYIYAKFYIRVMLI